MANRLLQFLTCDRHAAKQVLTAAFSRPDAFESLIEHGMSQMKLQCQQLMDLKVLSRAKLNQKLAACGNLAQAALATNLGNLADFLEYAKDPMPRVWQALADALADEKNGQTLVDAALATRLDNLPKFLRYAKTDLRMVWSALANALAKEENLRTLVRVAFATPLHNLVAFIRFTRPIVRLRPVHDALVKALVEDAALPADKSRLIQAARANSFEFLWGFVRGIRENPQLEFLATAIEGDGLCSAILNSKHRAERSSRARWLFARSGGNYWNEIEGEYWDGEED